MSPNNPNCVRHVEPTGTLRWKSVRLGFETVDFISNISIIKVLLRYAAASIIVTLGGCSSLNPMQPISTSQKPPAEKIQTLATQANNDQQTYNNTRDPDDRLRLRNSIISARIVAEDISFEDFAWAAWGADAGVATLSDWAVLGLTTAGSLATAGATQALSATAAAVTGAKTSLQKNALYAKTVDQLIFAMSINRGKIRTHIQHCMSVPDRQYGLSLANIDLEQYKQAAILPMAIANLATSDTSASTEELCGLNLPDASLKATSGGTGAPDAKPSKRTIIAMPDPSTAALMLCLYPSAAKLDALGSAVDASGKAVAADMSVYANLQNWMAQNKIDHSLSAFMVASGDANLRATALKAVCSK